MKDIWTIPIAGLVAGLAGLAVRAAGAPALGPLPRARDLRDRGRFAGRDQALRGVHGRRLGDQPLRPARADAGIIAGRDVRPQAHLQRLALLPLLDDRARRSSPSRGCSSAGRTGRAFRAIRDSETAAVSSGVSLARYKTLAFGISAAYAGVAGSLFAIATTFVNPDTFPIALSIFLLVGVVVGGLGSLFGPHRRRRVHPLHAALGAGSSTASSPTSCRWLGGLDTQLAGSARRSSSASSLILSDVATLRRGRSLPAVIGSLDPARRLVRLSVARLEHRLQGVLVPMTQKLFALGALA